MDNADLGVSASIIALACKNSSQPLHVSGSFCLNVICVLRLYRKQICNNSDYLCINGTNLTRYILAAKIRN